MHDKSCSTLKQIDSNGPDCFKIGEGLRLFRGSKRPYWVRAVMPIGDSFGSRVVFKNRRAGGGGVNLMAHSTVGI